MIRHMKANNIARLEIQGFVEASGQGFDSVLQLPESDLLTRWSVNEGDPIGILRRRKVANLLSSKHERVDIGVRELFDILVWSPNDMTRVDFVVHHDRQSREQLLGAFGESGPFNLNGQEAMKRELGGNGRNDQQFRNIS